MIKRLNSWQGFMLLMAIAAIEDFKLTSVYICEVFLQAMTLDQYIQIIPSKDIRIEEIILRLLKPLYRLDDKSQISG